MIEWKEMKAGKSLKEKFDIKMKTFVNDKKSPKRDTCADPLVDDLESGIKFRFLRIKRSAFV